MDAGRCLVGCWLIACAAVWLGCSSETVGDGDARFGPSPVTQAEATEHRRVCERYGERLSVDERAVALKELSIAPLREQLPTWRALGYCAADPALQIEALYELAWLADGQCVAIAIHGLRHRSHAVRAAAAQALAHRASPDAQVAKVALRAALEDADESDERQLVWALVVLEEDQIFEAAIDLWAAGKLHTVQGIDGNPVFDPERVAKLVPQQELAALADHPQPAIRCLAAAKLASRPLPSPVERLRELVQDGEISVAAPAAAGLARLESSQAKQALVAQLRTADSARQLRLLEAIRDGAGGPGLVIALDGVSSDSDERRWFELGRIFRMMAEVADPRIGDPLSAWLERNRGQVSLHWQTEAALRMAEVGDLGGAEVLGQRMAVESGDLYDRAKRWQAGRSGHLSRGDSQRIAAARLLGDLAILHPRGRERLAAAAGQAVLAWLQSRPLPHAHGLRFLAAARYEPARKPIHTWAFPRLSLPRPDARPPLPMQFEAVGSALRAIGWMRSPESVRLLVGQFDRKDPGFNMRGSIRSGRGGALRALALRNLASGAAHGLAHWGEGAGPEAAERLLDVAADRTWHEDVRRAACHALAFVADERSFERLVEDLARPTGGDDFRAICYAEILARRPSRSCNRAMTRALRADASAAARRSFGVALGRCGGLGDEKGVDDEALLRGWLTDDQRRQAAALALMIGGSPKSAVAAVEVLGRLDRPKRKALQREYERAMATVYEEDVELGHLHRWVANAEAIALARVAGERSTWAAQALARQLRGLEPGAGPHTMTGPMLRYQLLAQARAGDERAVHTLRFMGERGALLALAAEGGTKGRVAEQALRRLGRSPTGPSGEPER